MKTEEFSILTINLFRHCEESFVAALDAAQIPHGRMQSFTNPAHASRLVEVISLPASQMPWDSLATIINCWLQHKNTRKVSMSLENGTVAHTENLTAPEIKVLLTQAVDILVMDALPSKQANRLFTANETAEKLAS